MPKKAEDAAKPTAVKGGAKPLARWAPLVVPKNPIPKKAFAKPAALKIKPIPKRAFAKPAAAKGGGAAAAKGNRRPVTPPRPLVRPGGGAEAPVRTVRSGRSRSRIVKRVAAVCREREAKFLAKKVEEYFDSVGADHGAVQPGAPSSSDAARAPAGGEA